MTSETARTNPSGPPLRRFARVNPTAALPRPLAPAAPSSWEPPAFSRGKETADEAAALRPEGAGEARAPGRAGDDPLARGPRRRRRGRGTLARRPAPAGRDRPEPAEGRGRPAAPRALRRPGRQGDLHRAQLFRPRRRERHGGAARARHLHEG